MFTTTQVMNQHADSQSISYGIVGCSIGGIAGWATARLFTVLNPMVGLLFGAAASAAGMVAYSKLEDVFGYTAIEQIARGILTFLAGVLGGYLVSTLLGLPLSFEASLSLGLLMIPTTVVTVIGAIYLVYKLK